METNPRTSPYPIDRLFLERWSPRAFTAEPIDQTELNTLLEAAHWAPSAFNSQPWRFAWALRGRPQFETLLSLLTESNQAWAGKAAALVFIASRTVMRPPNATADAPSRSHAFDAGSAWGFLALQAHMRGWATHGMIGLDFERAAQVLQLPPDHALQTAVAIGRRGDKASLPETLQAREQPNARAPLEAHAREGNLSAAVDLRPRSLSPSLAVVSRVVV